MGLREVKKGLHQLEKEELIHQGFIQVNESDDTSQFRLFTKSELIRLYEFLHSSGYLRLLRTFLISSLEL